MADEIVNRVANSKLITIDLEDLVPKGPRKIIQLADWLIEGLILKEEDFRAKIAEHHWHQYENTYVIIVPAADAIVPNWAYLLLTVQLTSIAKAVYVGFPEDLNDYLLIESLNQLDYSVYNNGQIIIKGCSNIAISNNSYAYLIQKLKPHVKSLMFGEACSNVPLYKLRK